ncbi:amino acid adenylation domain-containing protein [Kibdelosporangium banguiense]|uniref:Amino acid adenylation domain-containing protein n=1 Tax=Kibdelosporangium banguiense TaxID=1365924 RepID=A0ABS4TVZ0_9PSEU|nr:amino acid adenylation domain-containing protein [Kibdelosporangium banguiense]MBP2328543.1 amino acid adenylation domain-containing protein [Kibdelosporangium banguiense]
MTGGALERRAFPGVPTKIATWAGVCPDAPAITQNSRQWTYRQLVDAAAVVAGKLSAAGVAGGQRVAVMGPRGFTLVAVWTAVLAIRAVLVPADPALPVARQRDILDRADHVVAVGDTAVPTGLQIPVVRIADIEFGTGMCELAAQHVPPSDESAYLFLTSGTTGRPKGIIGRHRSLAHFLHWQRTTFEVGPGDRVAHLASVEFDLSLREVFLPLTSGATLCLPAAGPMPPASLLPWVSSERITVMHAVPTVARAWLRAASPELRVPDLRLLLFSGEALKSAFIERWRDQLQYNGTIINLYGPTETTLIRCWYEVPEPATPGIQPLGRPIADSLAWIESADGQHSRTGESGEIVIRTPYGSGGYLDATADERARFTVAADHPEDTIFHTGDLGHLDQDGVLHFDGRADDQVKLYGVRVHLRAVEAVLEQQPGIDHAAVVVSPDPNGGPPHLTAHLVLEAGSSMIPTDLRTRLYERLPVAAVPARFVVTKTLPTTAASGKTDYRRLLSNASADC